MAQALPKLTAPDADLAYAAAQNVVETHRRLAAWLRRGLTLAQIDAFVAKTLDDLGCRSCFLGYKVPRSPAFPSHACLSLNECVVHGTAGYYTKPMKAGDVLKIDIGVTFRGFIGDAAWTYVFGAPSPLVARLTACGKESLRRGVQALRPGNTFLAWAQTVQAHVEGECGFHLVRGLGGHGYGRRLHAPPYISNVVPSYTGEWPDAFTKCEPGTLVAVEPMIGVGTGETRQHGKEWPVYTADGSLSVHYEHDVLITADGPRVLTEGLEEIPDVITA
jgi:methionyl aminopeptidase